MNSLLKAFKVTNKNVLIDTPYLVAEKSYTNKWMKNFSGVSGPIIGINWKGNRRENKKKERDFDPDFLIRHGNKYQLNMIYLQRGLRKGEKKPMPNNIILAKYQEEIYSLADSDDPYDFLTCI